jgi:outer membrane protein insertion porin family
MTEMGRPAAETKKRRSLGRGLASLILLVAAVLPALGQTPDAIAKIDVVGAQKITKENLLFRIGVKEGDPLGSIDYSSLIEKIWAIGVYDDIKIKAEDTEDGKLLIIEVKERPIVKEIDYRGGTQIGQSNIKDKIKENRLEITPDTVYDPETARKIKSHIVDMASEKGFSDPVVDVVLEQMGAGVSRLVFDINEGTKSRIYRIDFLGNKVFSDRQLKGFFGIMRKTKEHWMFSWITNHDLIVEKNIEEDIKNIKNAYFRVGHKDIFVGQPSRDTQDFTSKRQKAKNVKRVAQFKAPKVDLRTTLTFQLLEGDRYYEGKLSVEGNDKVLGLRGAAGEELFRRKIGEARRDNSSIVKKVLNLKYRTADLPSTVNRPMDFHALNKGIEEIEKMYRNAAYAQASISTGFEVRPENGVSKVDTKLTVREGERFSIRRVEFQGNDTTMDKVLRRAVLPLADGSPFSIETLQNSVLGLNQLGFFEVKPPNFPEIKPVGDKPQVDVVVRGEEMGVNEVMFSGGYGEVFGLSLGATVSTKNLGGGGETLGISFNAGQFQRSFSVSFMEPYVLDRPFSFGVSLSDSSLEYDADMVGTDYAFKQHSRGIGLSTGTRLATFMPSSKWGAWTNFTQLGVGYNLQTIEIEGGQNYYFRTSGAQLTSTLGINLVYSTVNHPFRPTDGFKAGVGFSYGGWQLGSDRPFHRTTLESSYFKSFAARHIFAFNVNYGYLNNMSSEELPIWDNFRPGGETSIRGYRYGWVGSQKLNNLGQPVVVGGNKQFLANAEYQLKIADEFRILLFYDMGNAWGPGHRMFSEPLRRSAGAEMRFFLPISPAPMRLIWAMKLNPSGFDPEPRSNFQFSLGTTF